MTITRLGPRSNGKLTDAQTPMSDLVAVVAEVLAAFDPPCADYDGTQHAAEHRRLPEHCDECHDLVLTCAACGRVIIACCQCGKYHALECPVP